jgi:hypothetical protein
MSKEKMHAMMPDVKTYKADRWEGDHPSFMLSHITVTLTQVLVLTELDSDQTLKL